MQKLHLTITLILTLLVGLDMYSDSNVKLDHIRRDIGKQISFKGTPYGYHPEDVATWLPYYDRNDHKIELGFKQNGAVVYRHTSNDKR